MSARTAPSKLRDRIPSLGVWMATAILAPLLTGLLIPHLLSARQHRTAPHNSLSTQISLIDPWVGGEFSAGYTETGPTNLTARCSPGSESDYGNPGALRCFAGNSYVYDPCFSNGDGSEVACPTVPWSKQVTVLTPRPRANPLTPYVSERQVDGHTPWGVQLSNGERCDFLEGTGAATVDGIRIYDQCEHGRIVGDVNRTASLWTANYLPQGASTTHPVPVQVAWF